MQGYIVTGTSRGLGLALVEELLKDKFSTVVGIARTPVPSLIEKEHYHFLAADLGKPAEIHAVIQRAQSLLGAGPFQSVTLINNAAVISPIAQVGHYPTQDLLQALHINIAAPMLLCDAFIASTFHQEPRLRILNISSGAATTPYPGWGVYGSTKAALDHFTRHIMAEHQTDKKRPITAVSLYPGLLDTEMQNVIRQSHESDFPLKKRFVTLHQDAQLVSPSEAARHIIHYLNGPTFGTHVIVDIRDIALFATDEQHHKNTHDL